MKGEAEFVSLISPLLPPDDAKALTWGGAAACSGCKLRRTHLIADLGIASEDYGECHDNGGGECMFPAPIPLPANSSLWRIWVDATRLAMAPDINGNLVLDLRNLELIAAAYGEVVDDVFLKRFSVMFDAFRKK